MICDSLGVSGDIFTSQTDEALALVTVMTSWAKKGALLRLEVSNLDLCEVPKYLLFIKKSDTSSPDVGD